MLYCQHSLNVGEKHLNNLRPMLISLISTFFANVVEFNRILHICIYAKKNKLVSYTFTIIFALTFLFWIHGKHR